MIYIHFLRTTSLSFHVSFLSYSWKIQWLVSVGHCVSQHLCVGVCRSLAGVVLLRSLQSDIGWRYCGRLRCCLHQRADVPKVLCSVFIQTALHSKLGSARASEGVYKVPGSPPGVQLVHCSQRFLGCQALRTGPAVLAHGQGYSQCCSCEVPQG